MNKYQRLVIIVALIDIIVMLLFPPFNGRSLARGFPESFDGYYPILAALGDKPINSALLTMQLMFVSANALAAWLVLQTKEHHRDIPVFRYSEGIAVFVVINLALIFLFPPFEPYQSLQRHIGSTFDSFYFVFGDRSQRPFYLPMLQLEILWVIVNALALWLLFNAVRRNDEAAKAKILALAEDLPDEALERLSEELRHRAGEHHAQAAHPDAGLGRGPDRRHEAGADYHGPERRSGTDRRDRD